jgi:hypothetical protein
VRLLSCPLTAPACCSPLIYIEHQLYKSQAQRSTVQKATAALEGKAELKFCPSGCPPCNASTVIHES